MPSKTWGTPLTIKEYIVVGNNDEIPKGQTAYVFGQQTRTASIDEKAWLQMLNGDLSTVENELEKQIQGSKARYIAISWTKADRYMEQGGPYGEPHYRYTVEGFRVEAIIENVSGGLTGLEIIALIMMIATIAVIIGFMVGFFWVTWQVVSAAKELGPAVTIGVGLVILLLIVFLLFVAFGGKAKVKGKKRGLEIGRG